MAVNTSTSHSDQLATRLAALTTVTWTAKTQNGLLACSSDASAELRVLNSKVLTIARQRAVSSQAHTEGTANTGQQFSTAAATLTVNQNNSIDVEITDELRTWGQNDVVTPMTIQFPWVMAKNIDTSLAGLYASAAITVTGLTSAYITEAQMTEAARKLDQANCPATGEEGAGAFRWLAVDPSNYEAITKIARFTEVQTIGSGQTIMTRVVPMLHGFIIFKDNNILSTTNGFRQTMFGYKGLNYANSSIVHGMTPPAPTMSNMIQAEVPAVGARITIGRNELAKMDVITCHQLYGVVANKTEWLGVLRTAD